jgi:hypothetical protein
LIAALARRIGAVREVAVRISGCFGNHLRFLEREPRQPVQVIAQLFFERIVRRQDAHRLVDADRVHFGEEEQMDARVGRSLLPK